MARRRRILLAVEPAVLAGALRMLLEEAEHEVVVVDPQSAPSSEHFDAAVVAPGLPDGATADVVIHLPDGEGNAGTGLVVDLRRSEEVAIPDVTVVLDLVESRLADG